MSEPGVARRSVGRGTGEVDRVARPLDRREDVALVGPTVVLRPPLADDVVALWQAVAESATELARWMAWAHEGYREDEARRWVEAGPDAWDRGEAFDFLVTDRVTGAVLGGCGLNQVEQLNRRANLGYWTRTSATGRGVATEAAAVAAHYGLGELGLARLEIVAATANLASQRVAAKLGAVREGVMRNRFWLQGRPEDGVLFSLVPADLGERRGPG